MVQNGDRSVVPQSDHVTRKMLLQGFPLLKPDGDGDDGSQIPVMNSPSNEGFLAADKMELFCIYIRGCPYCPQKRQC